jgi:predicted DNA-binding protein
VLHKGVDCVAFSIRLTEEEKRLADSYAKLHSLSMGEAFKRALFERIEDEFDLTIAEEAYSEYAQGGKKSRPITELWEECGL